MNLRPIAGIAAVVLSLCAAPAAYAVPGGTKALPPKFADDAALQEVLAGPQRTAASKARDGARRPAETLTFWGLRPGATVIELSPGGGYWTEILAPYAKRTNGRYIATGADLKDPKVSDYGRKARKTFEERYADAAVFGKVEVVDFGANSGPLAAPGTVDLVITARNIHNWLLVPGMLDKVIADSAAALKPGGVFAVEEHRSDPRPPLKDWSDGYVDEATVIAAAQKAGLKLEARSDINANPKDTKDHPFGVWTLPPTKRSAPGGKPADPSFDRTKYDAIGESDRMTLRFRKPG